jgi:hypothetical protein
VKTLPASAKKNRHTEFKLELFDAAGEARLRDVAALCSATEVLFLGNRNQVSKLPNKHSCDSMCSRWIQNLHYYNSKIAESLENLQNSDGICGAQQQNYFLQSNIKF